MIGAEPAPPPDTFTARLVARARILARARAARRALARTGDAARWRRAGLIWPLFAED